MNLPKVENMTSSRGNDVPNQFIIRNKQGTFFQSYNSIIVFEPANYDRWPTKETPNNRKIQLDINYWDYSNTTSKYRNQFLGESKAETQKKTDSGIYRLADLNK